MSFRLFSLDMFLFIPHFRYSMDQYFLCFFFVFLLDVCVYMRNVCTHVTQSTMRKVTYIYVSLGSACGVYAYFYAENVINCGHIQSTHTLLYITITRPAIYCLYLPWARELIVKTED